MKNYIQSHLLVLCTLHQRLLLNKLHFQIAQKISCKTDFLAISSTQHQKKSIIWTYQVHTTRNTGICHVFKAKATTQVLMLHRAMFPNTWYIMKSNSDNINRNFLAASDLSNSNAIPCGRDAIIGLSVWLTPSLALKKKHIEQFIHSVTKLAINGTYHTTFW